MKYINAFALSSIVVCLAGCATVPKGGPVEPTGASPPAQITGRERAPIDVNKEEFLWNNDFGRNDFLYESRAP